MSLAMSVGNRSQMRFRHIFSWFTFLLTLLLMGWGAVVTSMDAGLAVPDWPSSFQSYDPLNPLEGWWRIPPVLAEHGHRLMGMLVGLCTIILTVWTWLSDDRAWMKKLALAALLLVCVQGALGGLRVVLTSLDLAIVHACTAQLFLGLVAGITLFTSQSWTTEPNISLPEKRTAKGFRFMLVGLVAVIYMQVILGALLRHYGRGADLVLASVHIVGAFVVTGWIVTIVLWARQVSAKKSLFNRLSGLLAGVLGIQVLLGLGAFTLILKEAGMMHSAQQIFLNSAHMLTGAIMMSLAVVIMLLGIRKKTIAFTLKEVPDKLFY